MPPDTLPCHHCGAPISVPESDNFVTCDQCLSHLAVRRSEGAAYTERLDDSEQHTDDVAHQTEELPDQARSLARQNKLAALDREWEEEKQEFLVYSKGASPREPRNADTRMALVPIPLCLIFLYLGISEGYWIVALGALGLLGLSLLMFINARMKWNHFQAARQRYQTKRSEITRELLDADDFNSKIEAKPTNDQHLPSSMAPAAPSEEKTP